MEEISDEKIDEVIEEIATEVTQQDSIDESVSQHMGEMGFLWERVQQKLHTDGICFKCRKIINIEKGDTIQLLEATKVDSGVVAFVGVCDKCVIELQKEQEIKNEEAKQTKDK